MVKTGRRDIDLPYFTDEGKFRPFWLATEIMKEHRFATHKQSNEIYAYNNGFYQPKGEIIIAEQSQQKLQEYVSTSRVNETVEVIRRATYQPPEKFDNPRRLITVENGLLDVKTKELTPHTPDIIHLSKINATYNPTKTCKKIQRFILEIINPSDLPVIQEMFGYCLLKDYPLAKAFMFLGSGENGKSTLLNLFSVFLGEENIATPSLQTLLENRFASIELYGKLANVHADLPEKTLEHTGVFKMLTGKDIIHGEKKYRDPISFRNYAKLLYSANQLPSTNDRSLAFFRRWIIIEFPNQFPEGAKGTKSNILDTLTTKEELSGLLNWALEGLQRLLQHQQFSNTKSRKEIEARWIMQTDSLRAFCDFALERRNGMYIDKEDLWSNAYTTFCDEHNIFTVKKGNMTSRLPTIIPYTHETRPTIDGKRVRCWENVGFTDEFLMEFEPIIDDVKAYAMIQGRYHLMTRVSWRKLQSFGQLSNKVDDEVSSVQDVRLLSTKLYAKKIVNSKKVVPHKSDRLDGSDGSINRQPIKYRQIPPAEPCPSCLKHPVEYEVMLDNENILRRCPACFLTLSVGNSRPFERIIKNIESDKHE